MAAPNPTDGIRMSAATPSPASYVIVMNAGSGSNDSADVRRIIAKRLSAAGREHQFELIDEPSRIAEHARKGAQRAKETGAILVAVGGDGTINAVTSAALQAGVPLAVLPQGTFNFFGRNHGIPTDTEAGIDVLIDGQLQPVQVGRVNDRVFIVNASLGLYPQVLEDREAWKQRFGRSRLVAFWSGLATLLRGYRSLHIDLANAEGSSRSLRTPTLVVVNNALQLELIGIDEAPHIERGQLVAITLQRISKLQMLGLVLRGALGKLGEAESVDSFAFTRMTVKPRGRKTRYKIAVDGEIIHLDAPLKFEALPDALHLLLPAPGQEAPRE